MELEKFNNSIKNTLFEHLTLNEQTFIKNISLKHSFTYSQIRQLIDMSCDLKMWDEGSLEELYTPLQHNKTTFHNIKTKYEEIKSKPNSYVNFDPKIDRSEQKYSFKVEEKDTLGLGLCPVASEKTRCCNLLTLDAVESCGFDCSYCSIQSFYNQNSITFDASFAKKIKNISLQKDKTYHIGTGQSSDSLMWGNKEGVLDTLFDFAREYPNVILEFKTKSNNIEYLLENDVPPNILCTWSLNTPTIIDNEEHLSASLDKRLDAAKKVAQKGVKIGFHFHPIVVYENYLNEYKELYARVIDEFDKKSVVLVSFGTLTFIKPVIKQLRQRDFKSKITKMSFADANGKNSYPIDTKIEMFSHAYESFKPWHKEIFFYLCMEEHSMWRECFGFEYATNNDFERAMLYAYTKKMNMPFLL